MSLALTGTRVVVVGAGLSGLTAARELERDGAAVLVVEARERVGGRVFTMRGQLHEGQHAEVGADLIEGSQTSVTELAAALGLTTVPILRTGWGFYGDDDRGRRRIRQEPSAFAEAAERLSSEIRDFRLAGQRWDSGVAAAFAPMSVADWVGTIRAGRAFSAALRGLRGFFLADPEDLSLLSLIEQFASDDVPGADSMFRIRGGNDRLPMALAAALRGGITTHAMVRRIAQQGGHVTVTFEQYGRQHEAHGDFCIVTAPAAVLAGIVIDPRPPEDQCRAFRTLRYGRATRMLLQFSSPFWRRARHPRAFGTDLAIGAVWDGSEEQRGRAAVLSLLAGGRASGELQELAARGGARAILQELRWLGTPSTLLAARTVVWEDDPLARGGYAVFGPQFDPRLRAWLARPHGRVLFAGEHTSIRWQGYMSGAIESGRRAAAEVRALVASGRLSTGESLS